MVKKQGIALEVERLERYLNGLIADLQSSIRSSNSNTLLELNACSKELSIIKFQKKNCSSFETLKDKLQALERLQERVVKIATKP